MNLQIKSAFSFIAACIILTATSCKLSKNDDTAKDFLDKNGIDSTVKPQDDFFSYVNGAWVKKTEIPAAESGWS